MNKIILLRHGKVDIKNYKNISVNQFKDWITEYNNSNIKSEFLSKDEIKNILNNTNIIICSNLKRSIQSVEIFDKKPFKIDIIFNEAQLPYAKWSLLKLNPNIWLIFFRIVWLFGYSKNCESLKETKLRAKKATLKLINLSKQHQSIILVGHGFMNRLIAKELVLKNWNSTKKLGNKNWDYGVFESIKH